MSVLLAPPLRGGSGTFSIATWKERLGSGVDGGGQGAVPLGPRLHGLDRDQADQRVTSQACLGILGDLVEGSKSTAGEVALLWRAEHWDFEVKAVNIASPNILTFQLITGED
jgi:hypothetical protein